MKVDHELLYIGAVFHDLGLTAKYRSQNHRFEVDGANAARDFLRANGIDEPTAEVVWDAIALHSTREIPWCKRWRSRLLNGGAAADVIGVGADRDPDRRLMPSSPHHPRIDFERGIVQAFSEGCAPTNPRLHSGRWSPTWWSGAVARAPTTELLRDDRRQPAGRMNDAGRDDHSVRRYRASDVDSLRNDPELLKRRLLMSEIIAGIRMPDSKLAREATDLLREHGTPLLFAPTCSGSSSSGRSGAVGVD